MEKFYVYIYLDPLVIGHYSYKEIEFDFEPFYIGKGKNKRYLQHLQLKDMCNDLKVERIKNIFKAGSTPIVRIVLDNLTDSQAIEKEGELILEIGQIIKDTGPLTNLLINNGGRESPQIVRDKISKSKIEWHKNNRLIVMENGLKISKALKSRYRSGTLKPAFLGKCHSAETKRKIGLKTSVSSKGKGNSQYGSKWIFNSKLKKSIKVRDKDLMSFILNNWEIGRKLKFE